MSINFVLKMEGIKVIKKLEPIEIAEIASNISTKIANAFPEHNINQADLCASIAKLNMYVAELPNDMAMAKYFYKNKSIYFSKDIDFKNINTLAIHECIHFMQELKNNHGKLLRLGIYNLEGFHNNGMALNEAAVQHMASVSVNSNYDTVKYYNMDLITQSPDFYPLQTALLNEMIFFTGTYPLYHSTLYSNDVFKNTFIAKSNVTAYNEIENNFDIIFEYESLLSEEIYNLSVCSEELGSIKKINRINSKIATYKDIILNKTIETQNIILENCFINQLNSIQNLEDVQKFKSDLKEFGNLLINTRNYNFYNEFCEVMNNKAEAKEFYIKEFGDISNFDTISKEISLLNKHTYGFKFFQKLFKKIKLLFEEALREKDF